MFAKKKKPVFDQSSLATQSPSPASVNNSNSKSASYDPQFYASDKKAMKPKMLSPPPAVPVTAPVPPPPSDNNNTMAKQLIFHCQLAHGSQTGFITGFSSVRELYQKIADYYEFPVEEVRSVPFSLHQLIQLDDNGEGIGFNFITTTARGQPVEAVELIFAAHVTLGPRILEFSKFSQSGAHFDQFPWKQFCFLLFSRLPGAFQQKTVFCILGLSPGLVGWRSKQEDDEVEEVRQFNRQPRPRPRPTNEV